MGNSFGQLFRVTTFGESHGGGIGVVVDGCPPRIDLSNEDIQRELDRRRPPLVQFRFLQFELHREFRARCFPQPPVR